MTSNVGELVWGKDPSPFIEAAGSMTTAAAL
jgi:hypothetical protein